MAPIKVMDMKYAERMADDAQVQASEPIYKRHKCLSCGVICGVLILLVVLILVILALTVFKARDPDIMVNKVTLQNLNVTFDLPTSLMPQVNLQIMLNISVHNPNKATFKYTNSTSVLYYHNLTVGQAPISAGRIGAGGTENKNLVLTVQANRFLQGMSFLNDFVAGVIPVSTVSRISGRVNILNLFKHHAVSTAYCDTTVFVTNATLKDFVCRYKVKL
ncbi:unnamed protein product [Sphagnum troendelagicum]|uniref:Late embryogenesis abundant protein LEA-2 subgroup domain-containing protein n=1 Tax=Sphagnum troendelagicum TaxID=128251 RepID=A0ABP0TJX2_9BRYO